MRKSKWSMRRAIVATAVALSAASACVAMRQIVLRASIVTSGRLRPQAGVQRRQQNFQLAAT